MIRQLFMYSILLLRLDAIKIITLNNTNHVSLVGEVNQISIDKTILAMSNIQGNNFYFYINSPGGIVDEGERLVSSIRYYQELGKNITCIAEKAHSMAFYIFQNCNLRYILPSSKVMQHQISVYHTGELANVNNYIELIKKISKRINMFCAKRIGMEYNDFINKVLSDWWLEGDDIIKYGVADEMVLIGCNITYNKLLFKNCPLINSELIITPLTL